MLQLTLLRHAKSSWDHPGLDDFLRPLNGRGYRQGENLSEHFPLDIDVIWCSPSVRTYTTAQCLIQDRPELQDKLVLVDSVYEASTEDLLHALRSGCDFKHIAMIGHNPGIELLASHLCGQTITFKTAHRALLNINSESWKSISYGNAELVSIWRPEV
ncbi:histidine phosphatase family protein [Vibrio sp. HN007]|uniref:SixA phosphatase family protein n=1 Tax=Vibrio iocasae TaxID=3098914 RepID=UPI0035D465E5